MAIVKNLIGCRFGRLLVIRQDGKTNNGNAKWLCECDCGNTKSVASWSLRSGKTQSCGCIKKEQNKESCTTHGEASGNNKTRLYKIWSGIKTRCYNQSRYDSYKKYGARGISMCDDWKTSYESFRDWALKNGYNDQLTIDRINPKGSYCPNNCRWANQKQQQNNRTNNHYITFRGETKTMAEWSELAGFGRSVIQHRLERNWSVENALLEPRQEVRNGKRVFVQSKLAKSGELL